MTDVRAVTAKIEKHSAFLRDVLAEMESVIVGQRPLIHGLLTGLLADGHVLIEGVPGLAKSLAAQTLARCLGGTFRRIQFTPDLLPSDLVGTHVYDPRSGEWSVREGPVFGNFLLADEINRAPAKVQSALLEAMQERQVSLAGETRRLPEPFLVLATQNPIEHEGTYPLPEAQLDRFVMKVLIDYPEQSKECEIVARSAAESPGGCGNSVRVICGPEQIVAAQEATAAVQVVPEVVAYAVALATATREAPTIALGAGTRGAISMVRIGKAMAELDGRG
ncbi:MAG: AAA family ATPase, partial [Planctomycetes bacterium]|nr:AAA family ATPase [Planctomycetota bacterium]